MPKSVQLHQNMCPKGIKQFKKHESDLLRLDVFSLLYQLIKKKEVQTNLTSFSPVMDDLLTGGLLTLTLDLGDVCIMKVENKLQGSKLKTSAILIVLLSMVLVN